MAVWNREDRYPLGALDELRGRANLIAHFADHVLEAVKKASDPNPKRREMAGADMLESIKDILSQTGQALDALAEMGQLIDPERFKKASRDIFSLTLRL